MFGLSMGELVVLIIVALVVIGPKELPQMLRKLGQWSGKIRRFAADMRVQSGIDDALRSEGLAEDIAEIRKLARGEIAGAVAATRMATRIDDVPASTYPMGEPTQPPLDSVTVEREREYPRIGCDAYGALPDTAIIYAETFPLSRYADDPVYARGEDGPLPPEPEPPAPEPEPAPPAAEAETKPEATSDTTPAETPTEPKPAETSV